MNKLIIYTKPDCPLCEKAELELRDAFPKLKIDKIDISQNPEFQELYKDKVPVFFWAGKEVGHWRAPLRKLKKLITTK